MRGRTTITRESPTEILPGLGHSKGKLQVILGVGMSILMLLLWVTFSTSSGVSAGETSDHVSKVLEIPLKGGNIPKKLSFPLYEQNNIQYFSAGLGKEERSLSYPPYPLKLIFVKGARAFLANVAIEVLHDDRTNLISIPGEEVEGPWLFLNLPGGKYVIKATDSNGSTIEKAITLAGNKMITVYFRWP